MGEDLPTKKTAARWAGTLVTSLGLVLFSPVSGAAPGTTAGATRIGTVVALPERDYDFVLGANLGRGLRVRILHRSRYAAGTLRTPILTVGIVQVESGKPTRMVFLPTNERGEQPSIYSELNHKDLLQQVGTIEVAGLRTCYVRVQQTEAGVYDLDHTRFFLAPADQLSALRSANPDVPIRHVHFQQMALGPFHVPAVLAAIDGSAADRLRVPTRRLWEALLQMNPNVSALAPAAGEGRQVAMVTVKPIESP